MCRSECEDNQGSVNADTVVDVLFDNTTIPAAGTTFCVYHPLPTDDTYQAVNFTFTASQQNIGIVMMFSISDHAVENLKAEGYTIKDSGSSVLDCSDFAPLMISQWSDGYLLMQQAPNPPSYVPEPIPSDWGMLVGKNTSRKHVLVRWEYKASSDGKDKHDEGTGFHIHLVRGTPRPVNFGEAKFAISQAHPPSSTLTVPAGQAAWTLISQCTTQGSKDVWKGTGVEILQAHAFGGWLSKFRLLESKGGGKFAESENELAQLESCRFPHYANQYLEEGEFEEIWASDQVGSFITPPTTVRIKRGNSYRLECIYDTQNETKDVTGEDGLNCQFQFYYREIPNDNEPYPGFCMDVGQWFLRSPQLSPSKRDQMFKEWRHNPKEQLEYKMFNRCPSDNEKYMPSSI